MKQILMFAAGLLALALVRPSPSNVRSALI